MASFSVNTHRAYLNNEIVFKSDGETSIYDELTGGNYHFSNEYKTFLSAGHHVLRTVDHKEDITIEDAIKLGGSEIKKAFVFDNNPWLFLLMKDRLYVANIDTGEEKVEHVLAPDNVYSLGRYYNGKTCDCFLFNKKGDYSIYNVETGKIVKSFTGHIYSNNHLIIYRSENSIIVYDYRIEKIILEFEGQYSIGSKFFFIKEHQLYGLNLSSSYINAIKSVGEVRNDYFLYDNYLVMLKSDYHYTKEYELFYLGNGESNISSTTITFPYYIESWIGHSFNRLSIVKKELDDFKNKIINNRAFPNISYHVFCINIKNVVYNKETHEHPIKLYGEVLSYPKTGVNVPFCLEGQEGNRIDFRNHSIELEMEEQQKGKEDKSEPVQLLEGESLIGESPSGNLTVSILKNRIYFRNVEKGAKMEILSRVYDSSYYINAYFTSDGKKVVIEDSSKEFSVCGLEDFSFEEFDIEGATVSRLAGFNGYKPEIMILDCRLPVWRDPISLVKIKPEELSNHVFMSPNGNFSAQNNFREIIKNRITNTDITNEEYKKYCEEYDFCWKDSEEDKGKKRICRKKLIKEVGKDILFKYVYDIYQQLIMDSPRIPQEEKEIRVEEVVDREIEEYLNTKDNFTPLFLDKLGYVVFQDNQTFEEKKILIDRSVYFLNYVSFSYDSRYLAFGAKLKRDDFRIQEDGVFVLFDIRENKVVIRQDKTQGLNAVWMTLFSKKGDVAYYDSRSNAYIVAKDSNYKKTEEIKGKSLLCFSPSGKYIAFSDQNYIDYTHHPNANWGHQPSGNIFIHSVNDVQTCLEEHNDFGEGIKGVAYRSGSVASAAFSCDEKKLLAVGDDGVVVIRNLHIPNNDVIDCDLPF